MSVATVSTAEAFRKKPLADRQAEAQRILQKYPDRIPVVAEKALKSDLPEIDKSKYLVPGDLTVAEFQYVIRKRMKLPAEKAIFCFINKQLPASSTLMSTVYKDNKDKDGFLYVMYSAESTFGAVIGFTKKPAES